MKSILFSIFTLLTATSAAANQGQDITYSKVEICDSGYCDLVECQVTMTDTRGIKRTKAYYDFSKHAPRICELLRVDETIVMRFLQVEKMCIQKTELSDFDLNYVEMEDCEFYRYGR